MTMSMKRIPTTDVKSFCEEFVDTDPNKLDLGGIVINDEDQVLVCFSGAEIGDSPLLGEILAAVEAMNLFVQHG